MTAAQATAIGTATGQLLRSATGPNRKIEVTSTAITVENFGHGYFVTLHGVMAGTSDDYEIRQYIDDLGHTGAMQSRIWDSVQGCMSSWRAAS